MASSSAVRRSSPRRRISATANGSSATSASGGPPQSASASRGMPAAIRRSKRAASRPPSPVCSSYPRPRVMIFAPSPPASALRSWETYSWTILAAVGGGFSPHSPWTSRSVETVAPSFSASRASNARGLPAPIATGRPPAVTSTGPSTVICMCPPGRMLRHDGSDVPRGAQPAFTALRPPAYRPVGSCWHQLPGDPQEVTMRSHRLIVRRLRRLVLGLTALALLVPVGATAVPTENSRPQAREDQGYADAVASLTQEEMAAAYGTAFDTPAKVGDT